ncbi:MAG: head GIN domain-containing protein [Flavobacterium sp.]
MKKIIKITAILVLFTAFFTSCVVNTGVNGNGEVITDSRAISTEVTNIEVSKAIEVKITQGDVAKLEVNADSNILQYIETSIDGNTLDIDIKDNSNLDQFQATVYVTLPNIYQITTSSASTVKGKNTIITKELTLKASSSSRIELAIETEQLTVDTSSASEVILSGKAINTQYESSSSSSIKAGKLQANHVIARSSSASDIACYPIINLDAKASSSGTVSFWNNPKYIKKEESSAGTVSQNK